MHLLHFEEPLVKFVGVLDYSKAVAQPGFSLGGAKVGHPEFCKEGAQTGGLGVELPDTNGFLRFSYKNTHFLSKKDTPVPAMSVVTGIDNIKIFGCLCSKA